MRPVQLSRSFSNDTPLEEQAEQFEGLDMVTKPTALPASFVRAGGNCRADAGLLRTRPGFRLVAALDNATINPGNLFVQGLAYYDTPLIERVIAAWNGGLYEITGDAFAQGAIPIAGIANGTVQTLRFAQLVDRLYYADGWIKWIKWTGIAWTAGTVSVFSNGSPMPFFSEILIHKFRALAVEQNTDRIYVSAIGQAETAADWIQTQNVRLGDGEGDPIVALIPSPAGAIYALKQGSVWALDTTAASPADWTSDNVTRLTGCVAGRTAQAIGQDCYFLSRYGVVSLGSLVQDNAISQLSTLSAPIQPLIDVINWAAVDTAWAITWKDLYILAVPTDGATQPNTLIAYNTLRKTWQTPWYTGMTGRTFGATAVENTGWTAACVSQFGQKRETMIGDACGRVHLIDEILDYDQPDTSTNTPIESWAVLKSWDFADPASPKQPFTLETEFFRGTGRELSINLIKEIDGVIPGDPEVAELVAAGVQTSETIVSNAQTNSITTFPIRFPWSLAPKSITRLKLMIRGTRFREVAVQYICGRGRMQLRACRMQAFLDNPNLSR